MWLHKLREASELSAIPVVAVGDVYMHVRSRKALHDVMTAIRTGRPLTGCGRELQVNAERHLRTRLRLAQTFPADLLAETLNVADRCSFSLDELKYQYPDEVVPAGELLARAREWLLKDGAATVGDFPRMRSRCSLPVLSHPGAHGSRREREALFAEPARQRVLADIELQIRQARSALLGILVGERMPVGRNREPAPTVVVACHHVGERFGGAATAWVERGEFRRTR